MTQNDYVRWRYGWTDSPDLENFWLPSGAIPDQKHALNPGWRLGYWEPVAEAHHG